VTTRRGPATPPPGRRGAPGRDSTSRPAPGRDGGSGRIPPPRRRSAPGASRTGKPSRPRPPAEPDAKRPERRPPEVRRVPVRGTGRGGPPPRRPRKRVVITRRDPLKRLNVGLLALAFVLSLFAGRLVQLQGMQSSSYAEKARLWSTHTIPLPAVRGDISDADGQKLAMTVEARQIFVDPSLIATNYPTPDRRLWVAQTLASALGLDPATVLKAVNGKGRYVKIGRPVEPSQARMVLALGLHGVNAQAEYRRVYPNGDLAANLIGFVNADGQGGAGLEYSLNKLLAGKSGKQTVEFTGTGQEIPLAESKARKPVPGRSVRLTILRDLQYKAQTAIEAQVKATQAQSGTVIVTDPRNGQILAMASTPSYDPNRYGKATTRQLSNPAVEEAFEPGSTSKVVTAAAVMEKGGVTPDTPFVVPYSKRVYDQVLHDSEPHATEKLTFGGVLAKSSNVGTMEASDRVSGQTLYNYMRAFGYGQYSGLKLPGETAGYLNPPGDWSGTQRYTVAYGQGVSVNALQVASVYSTIANHGVKVTPTLIAGTDDGHGDFTPSPARKGTQVISRSTADELITMLEGVTTKEGTAPRAQIAGYRVAGKTGTAQRINPACHCYKGNDYTASFAGFAPAEDPQLMVEVVLQEPRLGHYGGDVAAPVFQDVMRFALETRKIPPSGSRSPTIDIYAH
jgi:cell division protein FtsI (penicillin-binding protein 3)